MKRIIIIGIILIFVIIILLIFLNKNDYKVINLGNNMSNKSIDFIKEYILNINSYEATAKVTVNSNKNKNVYVLKQQYVSPNLYRQEVLEPENIKGLKTIYNGKDLKIENTNLNLSKIYENYTYVTNNSLDLSSFIEDYKNGNQATAEEENETVILKTKVEKENKYITYKALYIDKNTGKPIKLEVQDITQKVLVYILYNEIKINNLQNKDILAFELEKKKVEI